MFVLHACGASHTIHLRRPESGCQADAEACMFTISGWYEGVSWFKLGVIKCFTAVQALIYIGDTYGNGYCPMVPSR